MLVILFYSCNRYNTTTLVRNGGGQMEVDERERERVYYCVCDCV